MRHLIICTEYPPTPFPAGGIGTYVKHISRLLAENGETVHVITPLWSRTYTAQEECSGRLIIHRVPFTGCSNSMLDGTHACFGSAEAELLVQANLYYQAFAYSACFLAEYLIEDEAIDVIEGQEYQAPLYFLQLRRALGFGPKRCPPCFVHLHSSSEFASLHNDMDMSSLKIITAKRLEDYSVATADALLCPSRYMARQVEQRFGLAEETIRVIPYPAGDTPILERDKSTWEHGTICYVGRLERRKGIIEWIDAAVLVAREFPDLQFDFVGSNILGSEAMSGEEFVWQRIPPSLRSKFHFHGEQKRDALPKFLRRGRIAVVPSRCENFPNTCVEAMRSGLPVIASREGGMIEMIRDGHTGWIANRAGAEGLADALRRAVQTSPENVAEMGRQASLDIREMCDNSKIVEAHVRFRSELVQVGSRRSVQLPTNLPWATRALSDKSKRPLSDGSFKDGLAIIIISFNNGHRLEHCLLSLEKLTRKPACVVVVDAGSTDQDTLKALDQASHKGWQIVNYTNGGLVAAKNAGIERVLRSGLQPIGFAFLHVDNSLAHEFVSVCESVLRLHPEVGLVSGWVRQSEGENKIWAQPCPSFPYQWLWNDAASFSVIRTDALCEAGYFRVALDEGYEDWDLFNAVLAVGWVAVTLPQVLGDSTGVRSLHSVSANTRMRRLVLERFPALIARDAIEIALLAKPNNPDSFQKKARSSLDWLSKIGNRLRLTFLGPFVSVALRLLTRNKTVQ